MADDVNVKSVDLIKKYSSKLGNFRDISLPVALDLWKDANRIEQNFVRLQEELKRMGYKADYYASEVAQKYEDVNRQCGTIDRDITGNSDIEIRKKSDALHERIALINSNISQILVKLENVKQKTKNFESQMTNMVDACKKYVEDKAFLVSEYNKIKI